LCRFRNYLPWNFVRYIFCNLPVDKLDRLRLEHEIKEIGKAEN
jgi:hypothetical protein